MLNIAYFSFAQDRMSMKRKLGCEGSDGRVVWERGGEAAKATRF
jgi:hypothetical protein